MPPELRRLRLFGIAAPVVFIGLLHLVRPTLATRLGVERTDALTGIVSALGALAFGIAMFALVHRVHRYTVRQHELLAEARQAEHDQAQRARAAHAVVGERERLAREMHDSLAQSLGAAHLRLRVVEGDETLPGHLRQEVAEVADLCHESYGDVRETILGLRDPHRPGRSVIEHLETYVRHLGRRSGIDCRVEVLGEGPLPTLGPEAELHTVRIVQEALTNARKHASAGHIGVTLEPRAGSLRLTVADDGTGFDSASTSREGHYGLQTMRERAALIGGALEVTSAPGLGTRVRLDVPAAHPSSDQPGAAAPTTATTTTTTVLPGGRS